MPDEREEIRRRWNKRGEEKEEELQVKVGKNNRRENWNKRQKKKKKWRLNREKENGTASSKQDAKMLDICKRG